MVVPGGTFLASQCQTYGGTAQFLVRHPDRGERRGQVAGEGFEDYTRIKHVMTSLDA